MKQPMLFIVCTVLIVAAITLQSSGEDVVDSSNKLNSFDSNYARIGRVRRAAGDTCYIMISCVGSSSCRQVNDAGCAAYCKSLKKGYSGGVCRGGFCRCGN